MAEGETRVINFRVAAPDLPKLVHGTVLGPNGKPVAGAEVVVEQEPEEKATTDAQGRLAFDQPGPTSKARLHARSGGLGTAVATPASGAADVTLRLAANVPCGFTGRVTDDAGQPVAKATVTLVRWPGNSGSYVATGQTDGQGWCVLPHNFPSAEFSVRAERLGYAYRDSKALPGVPGGTRTMPTLVLARADSFVAGAIVDRQGRPVAGAEITDHQVGPSIRATSDARGRFRLNGVTRGSAILQVQAARSARS